MNFVDQFTGLLGSGAGLMLLAFGLLLLALSRKISWLKWMILSGVMYAASLFKYTNEWMPIAPPLYEPLDLLVLLGRPLTIVGIIFLCMLTIISPHSRIGRVSIVLPLIFASQTVITLKIASEGDIGFALLSFTVNISLFFVMANGVSGWLKSDEDMDWAFVSIAGVTFCFLAAVGLQTAIDPHVISSAAGRLYGTTGNPQHAAVLLAASVPIFIYGILRSKRVGRVACIIGLGGIIYCLLWTQSRTGLAMAALSLLVVLRSTRLFGKALILVCFVGALAIMSGYLDELMVNQKVISLQDTRSNEWEGMWMAFLDNPLFGAPLTEGRAGFGENSWLAMAATTGLIGLLPLVLFGWAVLNLVWRLEQTRRERTIRLRADVIMAGLLALMAGSITEAYLLGNLTAPIMLIQVYAITGYWLVTTRRPALAYHNKVQGLRTYSGNQFHVRPSR